ncbi:MAG TPA: hypothetical protein VJT74_05280 [Pyrinomonadaceae bacterium]|nr:hypothetical protein [Pyrinomonadaceae bacterium]
MFKIDRQKWAGRFKRLIVWSAWLIWILVFAFFLSTVVFSSVDHTLRADEKKAEKLRVYNFQRDRYAEWDRDEAIHFGFEQLASSINYLFVAAAAIIGFISKIIIEPLVSEKGRSQLPPFAMALLRHTAWGCFLSIFYGFFAYLYFNRIPDSTDFSIYEEISRTQLCQLVSFIVAAFLLLLAVSRLATDRITPHEE